MSGLFRDVSGKFAVYCWAAYLCRVPNLLHDLVDFLDSQLNDTPIHPCGFLQLFDEHLLNIRYNLITKVLSLFRKSFLDEKSTEDPAKAIVHVVDTGSPAFWCRIRVLWIMSVLKVDGQENITFP